MRKKWTHFQQKLRFFLYRTTLKSFTMYRQFKVHRVIIDKTE